MEGERLSDVFQPILLLDVLKLVFAQFKVVARIHEIVTANMARVKVRQQISQLLHALVHIPTVASCGT